MKFLFTYSRKDQGIFFKMDLPSCFIHMNQNFFTDLFASNISDRNVLTINTKAMYITL